MKIMRKIIEIDQDRCDGCGNCVLACAENAIEIIDGKAKVVKEQFCDGLGACLGECPQGALKLVEREAEAFDEVAVEAFLKEKEKDKSADPRPAGAAGGCPSAELKILIPGQTACQAANRPTVLNSGPSALGHWPVQIRLIPPQAPFLKNADLLVAADCVAVAYPGLHQRFLPGRTIMIGCPKFDDAQDYIDRFTQIFKTNAIKSLTALVMEVPCCAGLPGMLKKARERAGLDLPIRQVVISAKGEIVKETVL